MAPVARRSRPLLLYRANPTTPCQTPLKQRPFRRTKPRRSKTKETFNGTTHSNTQLISYSTHLSATAVPALRAGRPGLVSRGNRASDLAPGFCRRGARGFRFGSEGVNESINECCNYCALPAACRRELLQVLSGADACGRCKRRH